MKAEGEGHGWWTGFRTPALLVVRIGAAMTRDDERTQARKLLLTALGAAPGEGVTEALLRRTTNVGTSLFHEVMPELLGEGLVVISHGDGRRTQTEYYLVRVHEHTEPLEGPVTLLMAQVLARLVRLTQGRLDLADPYRALAWIRSRSGAHSSRQDS